MALEESPQPDTVEVQFYIYVFNEGGGIATAAFDPIQPSPTLRRTGLASVTVLKDASLDHFAVGLEKDTIAFTETSRIFVVAKDRDSNDVALAGDALLQFSIDSSAYGSFIKANGDTVPSPLSNVLYSDAQAGNIRFAAVNKNPDSLVSFRVIARLQADTTKSGDTTLVLLEQTLKIVMDTPYVVRPSIPTEDHDTLKTRLRMKAFEVRMTRGGEPVSNHPFRLWTDYVDFSGGHAHGDTKDTRRENNNDNYGSFTFGTHVQHHRPLEESTNAQGRFPATFHSSIFGDTMRIYLSSTVNELLSDSISIVEKVDNLINFRNIPANSQWILFQTPTGTLRHPDNDNNWCTQRFADSVKAAIENFYDWSKSEDGGGTAVVVSLNDMSLPFGGRFDMSGKWDQRESQQHLFHRVGTSVDVNRTLDVIQLRKLTEVMADEGLERNKEKDLIHYGSNGGN